MGNILRWRELCEVFACLCLLSAAACAAAAGILLFRCGLLDAVRERLRADHGKKLTILLIVTVTAGFLAGHGLVFAAETAGEGSSASETNAGADWDTDSGAEGTGNAGGTGNTDGTSSAGEGAGGSGNAGGTGGADSETGGSGNTGETDSTEGIGGTEGGAGDTGSPDEETLPSDGQEGPDETAPVIEIVPADSSHTDASGTVYWRADNAGLLIRIAENEESDEGLENCHVKILGENGTEISKGHVWTNPGQQLFELPLESSAVAALGDGRITVQVSAEDCAGNDSALEEQFVLDTQNPILYFAVNQPVGNNAATDEEAGTVYYSADSSQYTSEYPEIRAVFTVEDAAMDEGMVECTYSVGNAQDSDGAEDAGKSEAILSEQSTKKDGSSVITKTVLLHPGQADSPDGAYRFQIRGTDLAGNALILAQDESTDPVTGLSCIDRETGCFRSGAKVIDTKAPTAMLTVSADTVFYRAQIGSKAVVVDTDSLRPFQNTDEVRVQIAAEDENPVSLSYRIRSTAGARNDSPESEEIYQTGRKVTTAIRGEQIFRIEDVSVRDRAGNCSCTLQRTADLYLDTTAPSSDLSAPSATVHAITAVTAREADGRPLFGSSVILEITAEDPTSEISGSGLEEVVYDVWAGGQHIVRSKRLYLADSSVGEAEESEVAWGEADPSETDSSEVNSSKTDPVRRFRSTVTIPAGGIYESNQITVQVRARDRAGNTSDPDSGGTFQFGIDTQGPAVSVIYTEEEENEVRNGQYFAGARSAVIRVRDRNPGSGTIRITAPGAVVSSWQWVQGENDDGSSDERICRIQWVRDGSYTLEVSGTDALGNPASVQYEGEAAQAFVIDRTPPVIEMIWEGGKASNIRYYNRTRIARVRILEENFSARGLRLTPAGSVLSTRKLTSASGDSYWEGIVLFSEEGEWQLSCAVTDLAGNAAVPVISEKFVIDKTPPQLSFDEKTLQGGAAYADEVTPRILYSDANLEAGSLEVQLKKRARIRSAKEQELTAEAVGESEKSRNSEKDAGILDLREENSEGYWEVQQVSPEYATESGTEGELALEDAAHRQEEDGLWICTASVRDLAGNCTRVEREYCLSRFGSVYDYTKESGTRDMLSSYYLEGGQPIEVTEYAGSRVLSREVTLYRNGEAHRLTEGEDYTVRQESAENGYCYRYVVHPSCFRENGRYVLTLESEDAAGHHNSSTADLSMRWAVDRAAPICSVTGFREGQNRYQTDALTVRILPDDDLEVSSVKVRIRNAKGEVLQEETYQGQYLSETLLKNDAGIPIRIEASGDWQILEAEVTDGAGNTAVSESYRVLVTSDPLVQLYRSGLFPAILLIVAAVAFSILWGIRQARRRTAAH